MKENKDNKTLHRVLHARQLGLKLIANVTYGYTSANFSGRMPCIEVNRTFIISLHFYIYICNLLLKKFIFRLVIALSARVEKL